MPSRYNDPAYQKQVSLQMLATPTLEIACRAITDLRQELKDAITDLRQELKDSIGDGSPTVRFNCLMKELEKRFPNPRPFDSAHAPEQHYIEAIDAVLKDSEELNAAKKKLLNIFTGGKLFSGENK